LLGEGYKILSVPDDMLGHDKKKKTNANNKTNTKQPTESKGEPQQQQQQQDSHTPQEVPSAVVHAVVVECDEDDDADDIVVLQPTFQLSAHSKPFTPAFASAPAVHQHQETPSSFVGDDEYYEQLTHETHRRFMMQQERQDFAGARLYTSQQRNHPALSNHSHLSRPHQGGYHHTHHHHHHHGHGGYYVDHHYQQRPHHTHHSRHSHQQHQLTREEEEFMEMALQDGFETDPDAYTEDEIAEAAATAAAVAVELEMEMEGNDGLSPEEEAWVLDQMMASSK